jgi:hypothetical protein
MPAAVLEPELDWAAGPGRSGGPEPFEDPELSALVAPAATPYLESASRGRDRFSAPLPRAASLPVGPRWADPVLDGLGD